jgi:hypothetical protein
VKLRYKDPALRRNRWTWVKGRDAWNNFKSEKLTVRRGRTIIGRTKFKLVDRIVVEADQLPRAEDQRRGAA